MLVRQSIQVILRISIQQRSLQISVIVKLWDKSKRGLSAIE